MSFEVTYSVGTLSVTNGSPIVTGTNTQFATYAREGFGIFIDGLNYWIASADNATQITLSEPYVGPTNATARYSIWPAPGFEFFVMRDQIDLLASFAPLRNNATLLAQQIADTETYMDSASASAIAAATSATAAAGSANAAATSATLASGHKDNAAASAVTATTKAGEAAASATAAAGSASAANASKVAAKASEDTTLALKNATQTLKDATDAAKLAAQSAQTASETARDQAALEKGAAVTAKDTAVAAKNETLTAKAAVDAAVATTLGYKNDANASAQAADTSEGQAALYRDQAQTAASQAADDADAAELSADAAAASAATAATHEDASETARLAAENARDMAAQYAATAQEPITDTAIIAALDYTPANKAGDTFSGPITIADSEIVFDRADVTKYAIDTTPSDVRHYAYGTHQYIFQSAGGTDVRFTNAGEIRVGPNNVVYHTGNLTKSTLGLGNVENKSSATIRGEITSSNVTTGLGYTPVQQGTGVGQGTNTVKIGWSGTRLKATVDSTDQGNIVFDSHLTKAAVGLGNVDNTSDAAKPISTVTQNALNTKLNLSGGVLTGRLSSGSGVGTGNNGIATSTSGLGEIEVLGNGTGAAMMTFHRPGSYASYFGLHTDNKWKVGGWSAGAVAYELFHEGHAPTKAEIGLGSVDNTSDLSKPISTATQNALNAKLSLSGGTMTGDLIINNGSPTIKFQDTDHSSAMIHCNANLLYVLRGGTNTTTWTQVNGQWPLVINLNDNNVTAGGNLYARGGSLVWDQGNLTNLNQLSNGPGYITSGGRAYPRNTSNGGDMNFNWSGQGGQPTWLWGGSDGVNYYVWNPSNFNVNYANGAGNSDTVDGYHGWQLAPKSAFLCAGVATVAGGVVTRRSDKNVSSITRTAVGKYTVNVSSALPSYYVVSVNSDGDAAEGYRMSAQAYNRGTGSFSLSFYHISDTPNAFDPVTFDFVVLDAGQLA